MNILKTLTLFVTCHVGFFECAATPPPVTPSFCTAKFCVALEDRFDEGRLTSVFAQSVEEGLFTVRSTTAYEDGSEVIIESISPRYADEVSGVSKLKVTQNTFGRVLEVRQTFQFCGFRDEYEGSFCTDFVITNRILGTHLSRYKCPLTSIWILNPYAVPYDLLTAKRLRFESTIDGTCQLQNGDG